MTVDASQKFLSDLKKSSVAPSADLDRWLAILQSLNDPNKLADQLVDLGHLTRWQANYLLSGRTRLRFGNYVLVDRLHRDELGDAFVGRHQQLDRPVNMLFLSNSISRQLDRDSAMMERLTGAADIVHPNLEHVHLIDRDSGRYLLVTDHTLGKSLGESETLTRLRPDKLPRILGQLADAISALHRSGLVHGNLSEESLSLDDDGRLTVTGFLASLLRASPGENPVGKTEDIQAIALIGRRLVARLSARDSGTTVESVRQVVDQLGDARIDLSQASTMLARIGQQKSCKSHDQAAVETSAHLGKCHHDDSLAKQDVSKPIPEAAASAIGNRVSHRIAMAISALLVLVTLWFLGNRFWFAGEIANRGDERNPMPSISEQLPQTVAGLQPDGKSPSFSHQKNADRDASRDPDTPAEKNPEPSNQLATETGPLSDTANAENSGSEVVFPSLQLEQHDAADEPESLLSAFHALNSKNPESKPVETPSPAGEMPSGPATRKTGAVQQLVNESEGVDRKIPATVDLPDGSKVDPVSLFGWPEAIGDIDLELLSGQNISKSDVGFELSGNARRGWTVYLAHPRDATKTAIAVFGLDGNELEFNWLPDSQQIPHAEYLRNCVLKCVAKGSTKRIPLRSPVRIEEFVLDREQNITRVDIPELQFLPQNAIARLHQLDESIYGTTFLPDGREDGNFDRRSPLAVHFSELPEYQMIFLVLEVELKNRSRLEASLHLKLDPRRKSEPVAENSMDSASQLLHQHFETVKLNHDNLKAMPIDELRRQLGVSSSQFKNAQKLARVKELAQQMEFSEKRAKAFREMRTQTVAFFEKPIPVTIYFDAEGIEVVLATTF